MSSTRYNYNIEGDLLRLELNGQAIPLDQSDIEGLMDLLELGLADLDVAAQSDDALYTVIVSLHATFEATGADLAQTAMYERSNVIDAYLGDTVALAAEIEGDRKSFEVFSDTLGRALDPLITHVTVEVTG